MASVSRALLIVLFICFGIVMLRLLGALAVSIGAAVSRKRLQGLALQACVALDPSNSSSCASISTVAGRRIRALLIVSAIFTAIIIVIFIVILVRAIKAGVVKDWRQSRYKQLW